MCTRSDFIGAVHEWISKTNSGYIQEIVAIWLENHEPPSWRRQHSKRVNASYVEGFISRTARLSHAGLKDLRGDDAMRLPLIHECCEFIKYCIYLATHFGLSEKRQLEVRLPTMFEPAIRDQPYGEFGDMKWGPM